MASWKTVSFSVSFIIHIKIVNTFCINKEKTVWHYVDLIVKLIKGNYEITQGGGVLNANLRTSKNGVCLDQSLIFVGKGGAWGEGEIVVGVQNLDFFADVINVWPIIELFFAIEYDFFLCLFTLCSSTFSFIALHDKQKRYNHKLKKDEEE